MTWRCPKGDEQSLLPAALGCRRTRGVLCRAVDVNGRRSSSHEVVHCIPTTARLANRLLGLAILWTARLGWGCTSGRCDSDQRKNNPAFAVLLPSRLSALICALQVGLRLAR